MIGWDDTVWGNGSYPFTVSVADAVSTESGTYKYLYPGSLKLEHRYLKVPSE